MLRTLFIASSIALCCLLGEAVHELGHVLHAWSGGGRVLAVDLVPHRFSSTAVLPNPHPLWVAWGGPLWGCLIPLAAVVVAWRYCRSILYLARFFAGLCLIGNGAYLGVGWILRAGDAGDLIRLGAAPWILILFGAATGPLGFLLWDNIGQEFGIGPRRQPVSRRHAAAVIVALAVIIAAELLASIYLRLLVN